MEEHEQLDNHELPEGQVLIATAGLPASGKTTWAKEMLARGSYARVNSDDLREQHPRVHEAVIRRMRDEAIVRALQAGKSVLVDNTNLRGFSDLRKIAREMDVIFRVRDFRNVPWQECVRRDAQRAARGERATGRSVIIKMAMDARLFKPDPEMNRLAIIIDLDGTLSDTSHRIHHLRGERPNWQEFFAGIEHDEVNKAVAAVYKMAVTAGYTVLFVSGRPEDYRIPSETWLHRHGFDNYFALFMRSFQDQTPDTQVKAKLYDRYIAPYFDVVFTLEDRQRVVDMWRDKGLTCFQVAAGDE